MCGIISGWLCTRLTRSDEVLNFEDVPGHSPGAPMPQILANDYSVVLAYEVAPSGEEYAIVKFIRPRAHYFGSPSDETVSGRTPASETWFRALRRF